ncbi:MAG: shikimate kinase [Planctomycetota bacterium]
MNARTENNNISLIGMPGVGKSTVGILLAKTLNRNFIDTDVVIQSEENLSLQQIMQENGRDAFCELEERYVLQLSPHNAVIATGGSVIYSSKAMQHLSHSGPVVHLDAPLALVQSRVQNVGERGVAMMPGQMLNDLFDERQPLYRRWADITVDTTGRNQEEVVGQICQHVEQSNPGAGWEKQNRPEQREKQQDV